MAGSRVIKLGSGCKKTKPLYKVNPLKVEEQVAGALCIKK